MLVSIFLLLTSFSIFVSYFSIRRHRATVRQLSNRYHRTGHNGARLFERSIHLQVRLASPLLDPARLLPDYLYSKFYRERVERVDYQGKFCLLQIDHVFRLFFLPYKHHFLVRVKVRIILPVIFCSLTYFFYRMMYRLVIFETDVEAWLKKQDDTEIKPFVE